MELNKIIKDIITRIPTTQIISYTGTTSYLQHQPTDNTIYICAYTFDKNNINYQEYNILSEGYPVRVCSLYDIILYPFPKELAMLDNLLNIQYNDIFSTSEKMTIVTNFFPTIINSLRAMPSIQYNHTAMNFREIIARYVETNELRPNSTPDEVRLNELVEFNKQFDNLKQNLSSSFKIKQKILHFINENGGNKMTISDAKILDILLQINNGINPEYTPILDEATAIRASNYIDQLFTTNDEKFSQAVRTLGIDNYCSIKDLKNIINLSKNYWNEDGQKYLNELITADIPGPLCQQATDNLCVDYIIHSGKLAEYSDYTSTVINPISIDTGLYDESGNYNGWVFFG